MAIQFPPVNVGDPAPANGDTYTYVPTQTEYVYNSTENSWSIVTDSSGVTPVIGKLQAGNGVTLVPADGDDVAVADVAGGAFRIDSMQNIDSL